MSKFCHSTIKITGEIGEHPEEFCVSRVTHAELITQLSREKLKKKIVARYFIQHFLFWSIELQNRKQCAMWITLYKNSEIFAVNKNSLHIWELRSSGILCSMYWQLLTDVSEQLIRPTSRVICSQLILVSWSWDR